MCQPDSVQVLQRASSKSCASWKQSSSYAALQTLSYYVCVTCLSTHCIKQHAEQTADAFMSAQRTEQQGTPILAKTTQRLK
jgi:hypothetical protein